MGKEKYVAYVGTYTHGSSVGIHVYDLDVEAGYMTEREVVPVDVYKRQMFMQTLIDEYILPMLGSSNPDFGPLASALLRCLLYTSLSMKQISSLTV